MELTRGPIRLGCLLVWVCLELSHTARVDVHAALDVAADSEAQWLRSWLFGRNATAVEASAEAQVEDIDDALVDRALKAGVVDMHVRMHALRRFFESGMVNKVTLMALTVGFLVYAGPTAGLYALGFTPIGPAAGSVAALIQSTFPYVTAGSWFAWAQSVSMTGAAWLPGYGLLSGAATWACSVARQGCLMSDSQMFELLLQKTCSTTQCGSFCGKGWQQQECDRPPQRRPCTGTTCTRRASARCLIAWSKTACLTTGCASI